MTLYHHRNEILWTNTELYLLRGFTHLLSSVARESLIGSHEWFSQALSSNPFSLSAIGQAGLVGKGAQLNWLLSLNKSGNDPLPKLLDHISREAGLRGAQFITAGACVDDCLFETLRRAGYCAYSWQTIWEVHPNTQVKKTENSFAWRYSIPEDAIRLESLQRQVLAPAVLSVTQFAGSRLPEFVLYSNDMLLGFAFADACNGKVLLKPLFKKDIADTDSILLELIKTFFHEAGKVFITQTSDQIWLTGSLKTISRQITPREELLVKHFAVVNKLPVVNFNHVHNSRRRDTVTPILPTSNHRDNL